MGSEERKGRQRGRPGQEEYYVEGNAVRRVEVLPDTEPDWKRIKKEREERERELEERRRRRIARRNHERALRTSRSYVAFLTMAVLVFCSFSGIYIQLQSDVTARMNTISRLETRIADLTADNDEAYKRINTSMDLESIRETAMNVLGMSYAKESQIIYYTVGNEDYMNQYNEIPER